eukprot:symbB.v1.2.001255.t1/scaffold65.1/size366479/2
MPAVEKPKQSDVPFRELAEDGSMKDPGSLLKEKGFKVGQSVRMKKDQKTSGILVEITGEQVKIDMGKGLIRKVPSKEFLSDSWAVFIPKPLPTLITDFSCSLPHENFEMRMHITKAKISLELQQLTEEHQGCYESLSLQTKPGRAAIVTKKVAVKKLVLIPTTLRVSSQIRDSTLKDQTWEIKTDLADAYQLKAKRFEAASAKVMEALRMMEDQDENQGPPTKKAKTDKRHLKQALKDEAMRPQIVTIDMPPLKADGSQLSGVQMRVLTECMFEGKFWIELNSSNLMYLLLACRTSQSTHIEGEEKSKEEVSNGDVPSAQKGGA